MEPPSYMRFVVDRNVVVQRMTVQADDRQALRDILFKLVNLYTTCCMFPT